METIEKVRERKEKLYDEHIVKMQWMPVGSQESFDAKIKKSVMAREISDIIYRRTCVEITEEPLKGRLANGNASLDDYSDDSNPVGVVGIITRGFYAGLKGRILYSTTDGSTYAVKIEILEGPDINCRMAYLQGAKCIIKI